MQCEPAGSGEPAAAGLVNAPSVSASVQVRLLGRICIVPSSGPVVELPSRSQRRLVAVLATHVGTTLRADQLCDLLDIQWGALRATVSRVRRIVGNDVLVTDPIGYRLAATTDIDAFGALVSQGIASGDLGCFDQAIRLWHGAAIDEFATENWAAATVARVDELRRVAVEERAAALIGNGRLGEATATLEQHLAEHPLRDRAHGLMMIALALDGRQAEAFRAYQRYREHLAEHVGTLPSAEVSAIERWIADPVTTALDARWPQLQRSRPAILEPGGAAPGGMTTTSRPGNGLPVFRSSFVGRHSETDTIRGALLVDRIVTLVGEGGVGKTRLAAKVAEISMSGGDTVWFVELGPMNEGVDVAATIGSLIGAPLSVGPDGLQSFIADRRALLVLDNCEHLVDAVVGVVDDLLTACPALVVMATSRVALGIEGERVVRVQPLDPTGYAADLLLARVELSGTVLRPDQRREVEHLCAQLDGNPLAIELAAPQVAALGLRTVADSLVDRFSLLAGGQRRVDRHRTLHAVVEWSDRLLTPRERAVFRLLGVFAGGFEVDAVEHVISAAGLAAEPVLPTLVSLVERSMVVSNTDAMGTRLHLLDTLRAYALEQLEREGGLDAAAGAHADWIASISDAPLDEWITADGHRRSLRLEREVDNWRDAVSYAVSTHDVHLAGRLAGSVTGLLLWGRPDLSSSTDGLDDVLAGSGASEAAAWATTRPALLAYARWGLAWLRFDRDALPRDCDRFDELSPDDTSGVAATMRSATAVALGDMHLATAIRAAAIDDPRTNPGGRDLNIAMAVYGACSANLHHLVPATWMARTAELASDGGVPAIRKLARVALSVAMTDTDPARAVALLHEAFTDPEPVPAFWERLVGTFLSRFLARTAPHDAARHLLRLLPDVGAPAVAADAATLATAAGLLVSTAHEAADDVVASLTSILRSGYLATIINGASERVTRGTVLSRDQLIPVLRMALEEIARGDAPP